MRTLVFIEVVPLIEVLYDCNSLESEILSFVERVCLPPEYCHCDVIMVVWYIFSQFVLCVLFRFSSGRLLLQRMLIWDSVVARTQGYSGAEVRISQLWCMFNTTLSLTVVWQWIGH